MTELPTLRVRTDNRDDHEHLREIGAAYAELVNEVARAHGATGDVCSFTGTIRRSCDGCDAMATGMERPEGWAELPGGLDYCPHCAACAALRAPSPSTGEEECGGSS